MDMPCRSSSAYPTTPGFMRLIPSIAPGAVFVSCSIRADRGILAKSPSYYSSQIHCGIQGLAALMTRAPCATPSGRLCRAVNAHPRPQAFTAHARLDMPYDRFSTQLPRTRTIIFLRSPLPRQMLHHGCAQARLFRLSAFRRDEDYSSLAGDSAEDGGGSYDLSARPSPTRADPTPPPPPFPRKLNADDGNEHTQWSSTLRPRLVDIQNAVAAYDHLALPRPKRVPSHPRPGLHLQNHSLGPPRAMLAPRGLTGGITVCTTRHPCLRTRPYKPVGSATHAHRFSTFHRHIDSSPGRRQLRMFSRTSSWTSAAALHEAAGSGGEHDLRKPASAATPGEKTNLAARQCASGPGAAYSFKVPRPRPRPRCHPIPRVHVHPCPLHGGGKFIARRASDVFSDFVVNRGCGGARARGGVVGSTSSACVASAARAASPGEEPLPLRPACTRRRRVPRSLAGMDGRGRPAPDVCGGIFSLLVDVGCGGARETGAGVGKPDLRAQARQFCEPRRRDGYSAVVARVPYALVSRGSGSLWMGGTRTRRRYLGFLRCTSCLVCPHRLADAAHAWTLPAAAAAAAASDS
ncbi:hypothetical protein DFH06DRAFT_1476509 [Mycena polygramma]|nr:hypothetical protein DFH06DRAFT_1476509 [Mycena polygramma]